MQLDRDLSQYGRLHLGVAWQGQVIAYSEVKQRGASHHAGADKTHFEKSYPDSTSG